VLALNQGPGKRFIHQLLERGRSRAKQRVEALKQQGLVEKRVDPDMARIAFDQPGHADQRSLRRTDGKADGRDVS
jgi:hypothetical protein